MKISSSLGLILGSFVLAAGCSSGGGGSGNISSTGAETVFGITTNNRLISFDLGVPGTLISTRPVSGLASGEELVAIDYRPGTGELYALGATSRLYTIDIRTGGATEVGVGPFAPALAGVDFGFDFNPVVDRIRTVSNTDQNLRLLPATGAVAGTDTALAYDVGDANTGVDPTVVASAYTNDFSGATSTTLYAIDAGLDILVTQGSPDGTPVSPNLGTLFTVGSLGVATSSEAGFDISAFGGAFACLNAPAATTSELYTINLTSGAATLVGTIGGNAVVRDIAIVPAVAAPRVFAITTANNLVSFRPAAPGTLLATVAITGVQAGEDILGLDFRPATGTLLGIGDTSRVYSINTTTGVATEVGVGPFTPALTGTDFGVDFNPVPDRLRVVSDADENLRLNPTTGAVSNTDTDLAYDGGDPNNGVDPEIVAAAYTNNFPGTGSTTLYGIDAGLDILVTQGSPDGSPISPNAGTLFTVGDLGFDTSGPTGLDVSVLGGALASLTAPAGADSQLYTINLTTGDATLIGTIGGGATVRDIAIEPPAQPILYAVTSANNLVSFVAGDPGTLLSTVAVTGLQAAETILAIDFRPATRGLVALGSSDRLYKVNLTTGAATQIGSGTFTTALTGVEHGFDFNPSVDRVRLVSDSDQNLRLSPVTGDVANVDTPVAYDAGDPNSGAGPRIVAAAYDANFSGTTSTTLYAIDADLDILVTQGSPGGTPVSPNAGTLFTVGDLGIATTDILSFDISVLGGAFIAVTALAATDSQLYSVNLTTGATTLLGTIGGTSTIRGLAALPPGP